MTIDLRKETPEILTLLADGVRQYAAKRADAKTAFDHGPVGGIGINYDCGFDARIALQFDARPEYEPDGTWTHDSFAVLERPQWEKAYEALQESDLDIILPDGSKQTLP